MRPAELASDTAMAVDNYIYTIGRLEKEWNTKIDSFVVLQPTSPLRIAEDIDGAVELFNARNADSVVTYVKEAHPIFWHKKIDENNKLEDIFEGTIANRQELPITYYPNGAVYVFSTEMIRQKNIIQINLMLILCREKDLLILILLTILSMQNFL